MQSKPWELGNPSTKSREITFQADVGVSKCCKRPGYLTCSTFAYWHVGQLRTNESTCLRRFGHAKNSWILFVVAGIPECPPRGELWNALRICCCTGSLLPTQMQLLWRMSPSTKTNWPHPAVAVANLAKRRCAWGSFAYPWTTCVHHWGVAAEMAQQTPN
jgi:hypothetical protein